MASTKKHIQEELRMTTRICYQQRANKFSILVLFLFGAYFALFNFIDYRISCDAINAQQCRLDSSFLGINFYQEGLGNIKSASATKSSLSSFLTGRNMIVNRLVTIEIQTDDGSRALNLIPTAYTETTEEAVNTIKQFIASDSQRSINIGYIVPHWYQLWVLVSFITIPLVIFFITRSFINWTIVAQIENNQFDIQLRKASGSVEQQSYSLKTLNKISYQSGKQKKKVILLVFHFEDGTTRESSFSFIIRSFPRFETYIAQVNKLIHVNREKREEP